MDLTLNPETASKAALLSACKTSPLSEDYCLHTSEGDKSLHDTTDAGVTEDEARAVYRLLKAHSTNAQKRAVPTIASFYQVGTPNSNLANLYPDALTTVKSLANQLEPDGSDVSAVTANFERLHHDNGAEETRELCNSLIRTRNAASKDSHDRKMLARIVSIYGAPKESPYMSSAVIDSRGTSVPVSRSQAREHYLTMLAVKHNDSQRAAKDSSASSYWYVAGDAEGNAWSGKDEELKPARVG